MGASFLLLTTWRGLYRVGTGGELKTVIESTIRPSILSRSSVLLVSQLVLVTQEQSLGVRS